MGLNRNTEELMLHTAKNRIVDLDNAVSIFSNVKDYLENDKDFEEEWKAKYYSSPEIKRIRSASEYDKACAKLSKDKNLFELAESGESSGYFRESVIVHEIISSVKLNTFVIIWVIATVILCILFNKGFTTDLNSVDTSRLWSYNSENTDNIYYDDVTFSEYPSLLDDVNKIQELISSSINTETPSINFIATSDEKIADLTEKTSYRLHDLLQRSHTDGIISLVYNVYNGKYFIYFNDYDRDNLNLFDKIIGNVVPGSNGVISDDAFVVLNNWATNNIFKDSPYETFNTLFNYVNSNFDRETARDYVIEYTKSQNVGGTFIAILFGVMAGLFGTMIIGAIFFDVITPNFLISSASKKAEKYNRVYESVKQYKLIKDGVISLDNLETSESDTDEKKDSKLSLSKDNTNSNNTDNSVSLSILNDIKAKVLFRFDTDGKYVDTANKIDKLKEILENIDEVENTDDSNATIVSKVNWFCRRYGKIIIDSGNAIYKLDNPLSRSEKADRLLKYVAISIDSIYDTKVASSETEVDVSLNTIENLMKLDGLN